MTISGVCSHHLAAHLYRVVQYHGIPRIYRGFKYSRLTCLRPNSALGATCGSGAADRINLAIIILPPCMHVPTITIDACPESTNAVVHYNDVIPAQMSPAVEADSYGGRDYHRLYFGGLSLAAE